LPPTVIDTLLAVGVFVLGVTGMLEPPEGTIFRSEPDAWNRALVALMSLPLAVRRVYPTTVFVVVVVSWAVDRAIDYPATFAQIGVILVFHTLGTELSERRSLLIGGVSVAIVTAWTAIGVALLESVGPEAIVFQLIATAAPLWLGREVYSRRQKMVALAERAERAEREREEQAHAAVTAERARIARELHDVVAHQMTVMTLQAEGASRIARDGDPRITDALSTIREAGHSGLAEMRRMVSLLRTSDEGEADMNPLPRLTDVESLLSQLRAAGMDVELEVKGTVRPLADGTELSAYRIIQESLTNAVRHAGPVFTARVEITYADDHLEVAVDDDGRGGGADETTVTGHGLVGMRERVSVLGGAFDAGPRPGGGFRVRARLPVGA